MKDTKVCPNCGKELPADMNICGYCGTRLSDTATEKDETVKKVEEESEKAETKEHDRELDQQAPNTKNASGKIIIGIAAAALIVLVAYFAYANSAAGKYAKANKAIEKADYSTAFDILEGIPDYKDSQRLSMLCAYEQGKEAKENGDYEKAKTFFDSIPEYEDAESLSIACVYELGKTAMEEKDYLKAKELFDSIPEYEDAKELSEQSSHLNDVANDKEAPKISGIEEDIDIKSGIEYNFKEYVAKKISITDNVTKEIADYNITCDNEAFEQGTGNIDTRKAQTLEFSISAKDEAGNEASVKTNLNIKPVHITKDDPNPIIYDGKYGTVKLVSFTHGVIYASPEYHWVFECKNMDDKKVMYYFPSTETFINDYQVPSYYYDTPEVAPGKIGQVEFGLSDEDIPEGVGDYNQIQTLFCISYPDEDHSFHYISLLIDTNAAK